MPEHASTGHRLVREVLIRDMHEKGATTAEIAGVFNITPTYVRRIVTTPPKKKLTAHERIIERVAATHKATLVKAGYGFIFP